jgi:hypothetical protein
VRVEVHVHLLLLEHHMNNEAMRKQHKGRPTWNSPTTMRTTG